MELNDAPLEMVKIETVDQARNWLAHLIQDMVDWRNACDVTVPDNPQASALAQKRAMWTFLEKHGQVVGALEALRMVRKISDKTFKEFNQRAINALAPTVSGRM